MPMGGGQIINTYEVDNYPGLPGINGFDLGEKLEAHAKKLGTEFLCTEVTGIELETEPKVVHTAKGDIEAKTVVIATGATHRLLGAAGECELTGMGVSYCATCDGAFFKGKNVAVIGGGDVALEDALFLARGCKNVYLIHRRDEFRGARILQERVRETDNITCVLCSEVTQINGTDCVNSVTIVNKQTKESSYIEVSGVFVAVGTKPNSELFAGKLQLDEGGYICADESTKTNIPGVFAAGDVRTKQLRQVVTAVSDGANAISSVETYLRERG
jgi:thioredoxin reductase (NADPH)